MLHCHAAESGMFSEMGAKPVICRPVGIRGESIISVSEERV